MTSLKIKKDDSKRRIDNLGMQAAIMHCVYRLGETTPRVIHQVVCSVRETPVCERTIRRHLKALEAYGFVNKVEVRRPYIIGGRYQLYSIAEPVALNNAIDEYIKQFREKKEAR